jgi:molybdopterin synthase catalytic subunit
MTHLTRHALDVNELLAHVQGPERGGTCVFLGTVRNDDGVTAIDYSAYEQMANEEIGRILSETQRQWPDARVTLQHRLGEIPAGEASIAIAAAAPHRDEAFSACRFVIEAVKKSLPIWKKEILADGTATWTDAQRQAKPTTR